MDRVVIIGSSCSGKTTMAKQVAAALQVPHIELDALHWLPDWQERPDGEFREMVSSAIVAERWVVDGNYGQVRDILWPRATTIVWLNYSLPVVLWRAISRTIIRSVGRKTIFSGNRETIGRSFFSRESILLWVITTYHRRRREFRAIFDGEEFPSIQRVEIHNQTGADRLLASLRDI